MVSNHRFILLYARKDKNTSEIFAKEKILVTVQIEKTRKKSILSF